MATGKDLVKLGDRHRGEAYVLGAFAPKDNPNWRGPWDCAEFASWLTFQCAGVLVGCVDNSKSPSLADAYSGAWMRDAAASVDEKLGEQYGAYARSAADQISGLAESLRGKQVDDLIDDARDFVKKSPAVAVGVAAGVGFVLARLLKSGLDAAGDLADKGDTGSNGA